MRKTRAIRFTVFRYLIFSWTSNIFPLLGVGLGVFFFTVVLSVMGGFVHQMKQRLLGMESHIEVIRSDGFGVVNADTELLSKISSSSSDIVGASPFIKTDAYMMSDSRPATVLLFGIDSSLGKKSSEIEDYISSKDLSQLSKEKPVLNTVPPLYLPSIVVGKDLLNILRMDEGDRVTLISTLSEEGPGGLAPRQVPMVVADTLSTGKPSFDAKWVVTDLKTAQVFTGFLEEWSGIQVRVKNPLNIDSIVEKINKNVKSYNLRAKPWTESNAALLRALQLERWGMSFVLLMVVVVGCFGIMIVLVLSVRRRSREIAVLRALGMSKNELAIIYIILGSVVGSLGVMGGLDYGIRTVYLLKNEMIPWLTSYGDGPFPALIDWSQLFFAGIGCFLLSLVASVWPAWEVMKIDPVRTLSDRP